MKKYLNSDTNFLSGPDRKKMYNPISLLFGNPSSNEENTLHQERDHCVTGFIEEVWNNARFDKLSCYLHPDFIDYSLPRGLQNAFGLISYLSELRKNIMHKTTIESIIQDGDYVVLKVKVVLSARANPANELYFDKKDEVITGYRILAMADKRITAHWEFI